MTEERKKREDMMTPEEKAEADAKARRAEKWDAVEERPSEAPGFEGATPRKLARALFNLGRKG